MVDGAFGFSMLGRVFSIVWGLFLFSTIGGEVVVDLSVAGGAFFATGGELVFGVGFFPVGVLFFAVCGDVFGVVVLAVELFVLEFEIVFLLEATGGVVLFGITLTNAFLSNSVWPVPQLSV